MSDIIVNDENGTDVVQYEPQGICAKFIQIKIKNGIVEDAEIIGGCSGNHSGIISLIKGMNINDVKSKLSGIRCGSRPTSCPDQLALALNYYIEQQTVKA